MSIFVNSITNALYTTIASDTTIVDSGVTVCLNDIFNSDPNLTPWIGVYAGDDTHEPERLVAGKRPWKAELELQVFIQTAGYDYSPAEAQDDLQRLWTVVHSAIGSNLDLSNTVRNMTSISNNAFERDITDNDAFFTNLVTIIVEVDT